MKFNITRKQTTFAPMNILKPFQEKPQTKNHAANTIQRRHTRTNNASTCLHQRSVTVHQKTTRLASITPQKGSQNEKKERPLPNRIERGALQST
jgi:hypothetical protein